MYATSVLLDRQGRHGEQGHELGPAVREPGRPLVVRALPSAEKQTQRLDRLRQSLGPSITVVRQLGIPGDQALQVFREMLDGADPGGPEEDGEAAS